MGAAMPHLKDIQAPIRMTIDEMDLSSVASTSEEDQPELYTSEEEGSHSGGDTEVCAT
jgi:hypothetical protein